MRPNCFWDKREESCCYIEVNMLFVLKKNNSWFEIYQFSGALSYITDMKHSAKSKIFCQNIVYYQSRRWLCEFSLSCLVINYCFIASIVVSGEQVLQAGIVPLSSWKLQPFSCCYLVASSTKSTSFRSFSVLESSSQGSKTSFPSSLESLNSSCTLSFILSYSFTNIFNFVLLFPSSPVPLLS